MLTDILDFILDDSVGPQVDQTVTPADNTESIVFLAVVWFIVGIVTAIVVGTVIILIVSSRTTVPDEESLIREESIDEELSETEDEIDEKS